MKLSEAILLGSVGTGQAYNVFKDDKGNTCVMGAAMVGSGLEPDHCSVPDMRRLYPELKEKSEPPAGIAWYNAYDGYWGRQLWNVLTMLNNEYKWTRPQIAAWVATIEPQDSTSPNPSEVQVSVMDGVEVLR